MHWKIILAPIFLAILASIPINHDVFAEQRVIMDMDLSGRPHLSPADVTMGNGDDITFSISGNTARGCTLSDPPSVTMHVDVDALAFFPDNADEMSRTFPVAGGEMTVHNFRWPSSISSPAPYSITMSCLQSSPLVPDPIKYEATATGNFIKEEGMPLLQAVPQYCISKERYYYTIVTLWSGKIYGIKSTNGCPTEIEKDEEVHLPIDVGIEFKEILVCPNDKTGVGPCPSIVTCPACDIAESFPIEQTSSVKAAVDSWKEGRISNDEYLKQVAMFVETGEIETESEPILILLVAAILVGLAIIGAVVAIVMRRRRSSPSTSA